MPSSVNAANAYIVGWCLYYLQGTLYPIGTFFSLFLLVVLICVSLYYWWIANTHYHLSVYFSGLNLLIVFLSIYGIFSVISYGESGYIMGIPKYIYLKNIWMSLLPIYVFFVFFKRKMINEKSLYFWLFIFFIITIADYYTNQRIQLARMTMYGSGTKECTNNVGYEFLSLIPACTLLYKKPIVQFFLMFICVIFILMAVKRGAIFIVSLCLFYFLWKRLKYENMKSKFVFIVLSLILCVACFLVAKWHMNESFLFQKRLEDTLSGDSSGRDVMYKGFIDFFWNETSPAQFLFGSGSDGSLKLFGIYAHNDWLEFAINQGLLGIVVYMVYWILFVRTVLSKNYDSHIRLALQLLFVVYFFKTFFSMSYITMTIPATFTLGYCLSRGKNDEQVIYRN